MTPTTATTAPDLETYDRCRTNRCPHCEAGCPPPPDVVADGSTSGLWELDEDVRRTLPPRFHLPTFDGLGTPNAWLCTACWGEDEVTQWPCHVAVAHGVQVAKTLGVGWSW